MCARSQKRAGWRRATQALPLLMALAALACGPGPAPAPSAPEVDTVELVLAFDEPVTIEGDPTPASVTSVVLPPGEGAGAFEGFLGIESPDGTASELHLRVQVD